MKKKRGSRGSQSDPRFAALDRDDPFGKVYGCYKQLLASAESGQAPTTNVLLAIVEMIRNDASVHEAAGNFLKADIERRWSEGLRLHFSLAHKDRVAQVSP